MRVRCPTSVHDRLRLKETRLLDELEGAKAERDAALLKLAKVSDCDREYLTTKFCGVDANATSY